MTFFGLDTLNGLVLRMPFVLTLNHKKIERHVLSLGSLYKFEK